MPDTVVSYYRAPVATSAEGELPRVDREARVIHNYAVATRGQALGHGMWLDAAFLDQIVAAGNKRSLAINQRGGFSGGVKMRFTHPGLSADGMGTQVGRATNFWRDGDVVRADAYFYRELASQRITDHIETILDLAEKDPGAFGSSIVFQRDPDAEAAFAKAHQDDAGEFASPEAHNEENFPHARLAKLHASDVVDEPAANPGGFLSDTGELAARAESLLLFAFGLSDRHPDALLLGGLPPQKLREFLAGFLQRHALTIVPADLAAEDGEEEPDSDEMVTCPQCGHAFMPKMAAGACTATTPLTVEPASAEPPALDPAEPEPAPFSALPADASALLPTSEDDADGLRAISYRRAHPTGTPLAPKTDPWNGPGEVAKADVGEMVVMCAWVETGGEDRKGAYKLPHHKAGSHAAVWRGVAAAAARLPMTTMPDSDKGGVRMHLSQHYREFDEQPPWDRQAAAWQAYETLCAQLQTRGDVSDSDLLGALELCGLRSEAEGLAKALLHDVGPTPEPTRPLPIAPAPVVSPEDALLHDPQGLGHLIQDILNERLLAVTGRLPH